MFRHHLQVQFKKGFTTMNIVLKNVVVAVLTTFLGEAFMLKQLVWITMALNCFRIR